MRFHAREEVIWASRGSPPENAVVGFTGAAVGTASGLADTAAIDTYSLRISGSFAALVIVAVLVLGTALAMAIAAITAFPALHEKPLKVLRHD
jgi:hypothetical protein